MKYGIFFPDWPFLMISIKWLQTNLDNKYLDLWHGKKSDEEDQAGTSRLIMLVPEGFDDDHACYLPLFS